jgi:hypothetical protein
MSKHCETHSIKMFKSVSHIRFLWTVFNNMILPLVVNLAPWGELGPQGWT